MHWDYETQYGWFTVPSVKEVIMWIVIIVMFTIFGFFLINDTTAEAAERPISGFSKLMQKYYDAGGGQYTREDLELLSNVMQLENGDASDKVLLLTGSVVLNRMAHKWFPNTMREVIYQGYQSKGAQQYATATLTRIGKVKVTDRVRRLASFLLTFGSIAPKGVVFQSMNPNLGSKLYYSEKGEYFAWE